MDRIAIAARRRTPTVVKAPVAQNPSLGNVLKQDSRISSEALSLRMAYHGHCRWNGRLKINELVNDKCVADCIRCSDRPTTPAQHLIPRWNEEIRVIWPKKIIRRINVFRFQKEILNERSIDIFCNLFEINVGVQMKHLFKDEKHFEKVANHRTRKKELWQK